MGTVKLAALALPFVLILAFLGAHDLATVPALLPSNSSPLPSLLPAGLPSGFLGAWEAVDPGIRPNRVIIQRVDAFSASILYNWGDASQDGTWLRARAKVMPDGKLYWRFPGAFTLTLSSDGQTLIAERVSGGWKAAVTFRRVSRI